MTGGGLVGVGGPAGRLRSAGFHCAQQLIRHQRHVRRLISLPLCLGQPTTPKMYAFSSNIYFCISHRPRPYPSVFCSRLYTSKPGYLYEHGNLYSALI